MTSNTPKRKPLWTNHGIVLNVVALVSAICASFGLGINAHEKAVVVVMILGVLNLIFHAIAHKKANDGADGASDVKSLFHEVRRVGSLIEGGKPTANPKGSGGKASKRANGSTGKKSGGSNEGKENENAGDS